MAEYIDGIQKSALAAKNRAAKSAFFWLSSFYFVYCARPEDWVPGLSRVPLAKITGVLALWGLYKIGGLKSRVLRELPMESRYLLGMIGLLYVSAILSPVWKGGALSHTIDFSKSYIVWLLTFLLVTDFLKLRRLMFIQTTCVVLISFVSVVKGHGADRLQGVLGGIYGNPNDMAFAIVLCIPFALAFLIGARKMSSKVAWFLGILMMSVALLLTASRAGFVDLLVSGSVCLWHFGIRGKRMYLIVATAVLGVLMMATAGKHLQERLAASTGSAGGSFEERQAYGSVEARKYLMRRALEGIEHYPVFGIGINNFVSYSLIWHEVHMSYLQIAVEGGIPVLVLYLLFFAKGFSNLIKLRKMPGLDEQNILLLGALHSSLVGFVVGALFAPEAYQFFPYFTVGYTSALMAVMQKQQPSIPPVRAVRLGSMARLQAETYAPS